MVNTTSAHDILLLLFRIRIQYAKRIKYVQYTENLSRIEETINDHIPYANSNSNLYLHLNGL